MTGGTVADAVSVAVGSTALASWTTRKPQHSKSCPQLAPLVPALASQVAPRLAEPAVVQPLCPSGSVMKLPSMQCGVTLRQEIANSLRNENERLRTEIDEELAAERRAEQDEARKRAAFGASTKRRRAQRSVPEGDIFTFPPLAFCPKGKPRSPALLDSPIPGVSSTHHGVFCSIPEFEELFADDDNFW